MVKTPRAEGAPKSESRGLGCPAVEAGVTSNSLAQAPGVSVILFGKSCV